MQEISAKSERLWFTPVSDEPGCRLGCPASKNRAFPVTTIFVEVQGLWGTKAAEVSAVRFPALPPHPLNASS